MLIAEDQPLPIGLASRFAETLDRHGVEEMHLMHGTFVGTDIGGLFRQVGRYLPALGDALRRRSKDLFDRGLGSLANFPPDFADRLSSELGGFPVRTVHWTGENNHLGRLDAMIRWLDRFAIGDELPQRILIWAHSHGGNVLALLSQVLAADLSQRLELVASLRSHFRVPVVGRVDEPVWRRVADWLCSETMTPPRIDFVTMGMPVRYRFDANARPLHIVHHQDADAGRATRAALPRYLSDLLEATTGDSIQHLGTAGTDFRPPLFVMRDRFHDRRLHRRFEPWARRRRLWRNLRLGRRVHPDGLTLLVRYPKDPLGVHRNVFGHAVYTHRLHLPLHLQATMRYVYAADGSPTVAAGRCGRPIDS